MNPRKYDVVTVGLQCIDIVSLPVTADALERELTLVRSTRMAPGGDALNQAVTLSMLGARVGLMGLVGNDRLGSALTDMLSEYPLDMLDCRADVNTAVCQVLVEPGGERHFISQPESNRLLAYEHIDEDAVRNASFLSVGGCLYLPGLDGEGMHCLLDLARRAGTKTALDFRLGGSIPGEAGLRALLSRADYVLPNEREAEALTGESGDPARMAQCLRDLGAANCIIKLGERGCYVAAEGFEGLLPACSCRVKDTTGAGDTFVGAFLYARTRGWEIETCARFANAAASITVEHVGASGAVRSAEQVLERMQGESSGMKRPSCAGQDCSGPG